MHYVAVKSTTPQTVASHSKGTRDRLRSFEGRIGHFHWRWSLRRECLLHAGRPISCYLRRAELGSARQLTPEALIGQLSGRKFGKLLVRVTLEFDLNQCETPCSALSLSIMERESAVSKGQRSPSNFRSETP